ncbi:hypothetical protein [Anaerospora sp.]|uniref:hypothetical protein n=1 Tax=Anaerospora sp. TaxID=1960278 RepID=UPI00289D2A5C|nr:hypothetical protein [Anaerospora sp.]
MMRVIQQEWKYFLSLLLILLVFSVAYYEYKQYAANKQTTTEKQPTVIVNTSGEKGKASDPQVVYIQGQSSVTKEVVYVPKETDAKTGITEKTDVQFEKKQGKIYVKVNGKEFEVPADVKEDTKFENGKLVVTEQTEMRINLTTPKPAVNLGVGWGNQGPAAQINGPLYKNVSWWVYGDPKSVAGGVQFPIMNK